MRDGEFQQLLGRAREGDEAAWTELYDWLAPLLAGYLRSHRAPHPEDGASEVILQLVRDIDRFRGSVSSFRSWVFSIAHNRMVDQFRAAARRPSLAVDDDALDAVAPAHEWESDVVDSLAGWELAALFANTTADQREVLVLRFVVGLTMSEIAAVTGKKLGAVKALQRRGLRAVREVIDEGAYPLVPSRALTQA